MSVRLIWDISLFSFLGKEVRKPGFGTGPPPAPLASPPGIPIANGSRPCYTQSYVGGGAERAWMSLTIYLDGEYVPEERARVSVFDHGFLYGDGVFEGIRAYNGRVFRLQEHIERLFHSA